jgi:hypothetical protein
MAMNTQKNSTRAAHVDDANPTPVSSYIGLGIMAAIAVMMVYLQITG